MLALLIFALSLVISSSADGNYSAACTLGSLLSTTCDDGAVIGLTNQIVGVLNQMGHRMKQLDSRWIHCQEPSCVHTLQGQAADALAAAAQSRNDFITLNSAFRSSASQYLLYSWWRMGRCSIQIAAEPGKSNHEAGRAIDVAHYDYWRSALQAHGWTWYGSGDVVHYDYLHVPDIRMDNLKAFQALWNAHVPSRKLAVDGIYGPATAAAFHDSPCNGW